MAYIINLLLRYIEIYYISVAQIYIERYIIYLLLRYISVAQMYRCIECQGWGSLVGCCLWGRTESDMPEAT